MFADELMVVRHFIKIGAFNASVFNNLGHEYSNIMVALAIHGGLPLGFVELSSYLLSHETRLNYNNTFEIKRYQVELKFTKPPMNEDMEDGEVMTTDFQTEDAQQ